MLHWQGPPTVLQVPYEPQLLPPVVQQPAFGMHSPSVAGPQNLWVALLHAVQNVPEAQVVQPSGHGVLMPLLFT